MTLVSLKLLVRTIQLDSSVASTSSHGDLHWLSEDIKAICALYCFDSIVRILENDKSLSFSFKVCFGHDINDVAELGEKGSERVDQRLNLDALFKIADINPDNYCQLPSSRDVSKCNDTDVEIGGVDAILTLDLEA